MYVRLATGEWRHIPGRLEETHEGYLLPVEDFSGLAPEIVLSDLLIVARKLLRAAQRNREHLRHEELNRRRLILAQACIERRLKECNPIYC